MDFFTSLKISSSGLSAQRQRMNMISSNLANIETTRTPEGGPYKRKDVVLVAEPVSEFDKSLESSMSEGATAVRVSEVVEDKRPPKMVYNPNHPDADVNGYVALPRVNLMEEMVDMLSATRAYEANATAIGATKSMAQRALDIGR